MGNGSIKVLVVGAEEGARLLKQAIAAGERADVELTQVGRLGDGILSLHRERFDVVLLDLSLEESKGFDSLIWVRQAAPDTPVVVLSGVDNEALALRALEEGAQEYLAEGQYDGKRLLRSIRYAVARREAQAAQAPQRPAVLPLAGQVIAFVGAKGGCGTTTVACHTAVELSLHGNRKVLLADFDFVSGILRFVAKADTQYSLFEATDNLDRLDHSFFQGLVYKKTKNLNIIPGPMVLTDRALPNRSRLERVLRFARDEYDWTVVDLGSWFSYFAPSLLDVADMAFIVSTPDVLAFYRTKRILEMLSSRNYSQYRLHLVVNRMQKVPEIGTAEIERLVGLPVHTVLPDSHGDVLRTYAEGTLVSRSSALGREITRFANRVAGIEEPTVRKRRFSLLGWSKPGA